MTTYKYKIDGIDCAACAEELEEDIAKLPGITKCSLKFGVHSYLQYEYEGNDAKEIAEQMCKIIEDDQDNPIITEETNKGYKTYKYRIQNIDCAQCANHIGEKTEKILGVEDVKVDFMHEMISITCAPKEKKRITEEFVTLVAKEEPEVNVSDYADEMEEEEENTKTMLVRLMIGAGLFVVGLFLEGIPQIGVSLAAYLVLGYDVLWKAIKNIGKGRLFDENFLMSIATIAAIYLQDWKEAAGVMLFYQIGEYFQAKAVEHSRRSIGDLMNIRPEFAMVQENGEYIKKSPEEVVVGDIVRVKPGERIPLDGIVQTGTSSLDTASLTGESKPRDVDVNDEVLSGSINQTGVLEIQVTKEYGESTVTKILDLVENSDKHQASQEKFITKFAKYYTPIVVLSAMIVMVITGLLYQNINVGIERACTFLVISCPCALVISIPLSFFAGIGGLSSKGILVKGADVIDSLAKIKQMIMDKTGTLTSGKFAVEEILSAKDEKEILKDAAIAEHFSNHPIAKGIQAAYTNSISDTEITENQEIPGRGLQVVYQGNTIIAGNAKLMKDQHVSFQEEESNGTLVYVAKNDIYEGCLVLRDQLKDGAIEAIRQLKKDGIQCVIVSGDNQAVTDEIGKKLGVDQAIGECLPEQKVDTVRGLMNQGLSGFVGDGVNDAPVIHIADVGIAMGGIGSDAAIEAADVVLMDDAPGKLSLAVHAANRILKVANENIVGAILIKVIVLILGALGYANMWMAIFADTGVAMLCVLNSMRLLYIARRK